MTRHREVENWLRAALYDWETAQDMFRAGRFPYTVFFCHLAIEKALKARIHKITGKTPPKSHDLILLLRLANLSPPSDIRDFMGKLSGASTATRYPADLQEILKTYTREAVQEYLGKTKETLRWIENHVRS